MSITIHTDVITHGINEALSRAEKVERDPEKMGKAIDEINRIREEIRKRNGTVNVAVDLIREVRNQ